jgi:hypothetical protein
MLSEMGLKIVVLFSGGKPWLRGMHTNELLPTPSRKCMDLATPNAFDNAYFGSLLSQRGVLHSDQQLFSGGATYAANARQFCTDFAAAMVRLGSIGMLTGNQGQVRVSCSRMN